MITRKKILVLIDWFDPAFRAGGPIRSCVNIVQHLNRDYSLFVLTGTTDLGETERLKDIQAETWVDYKGMAQVYYIDVEKLDGKKLLDIVSSIQPDVLYLNSFFSKKFTLLPLWLKRSGKLQQKLVLAPRGMMKASALAFKPFKKKLFIRLFRLLGIPKLIRFHATDKQEFEDILHFFPGAQVSMASNLPGPVAASPEFISKRVGDLSVIFIGRIHPIKNLYLLLEELREANGKISLTIVGVKEDEVYWEKCEQLIQISGNTLTVNFLGELPHDEILQKIIQHHIFTLPTQGENFGHAIFEALALGRPVLISDQTPWKNLYTEKAGWDLPLKDKGGFTQAIEEALAWNQETYDGWCNNALQKAQLFIKQSEIKADYLQLFS